MGGLQCFLMHSKARLGSLDYMERVCPVYGYTLLYGTSFSTRDISLEDRQPGSPSAIVIDVTISKSYVNIHLIEYFFIKRYQQSCGFGVPLYSYVQGPTASRLNSSTTRNKSQRRRRSEIETELLDRMEYEEYRWVGWAGDCDAG